MSTFTINDISTPSEDIKITLNIDDAVPYDSYYLIKLEELGSFTIGSDDDDDVTMFPGQIEFSFAVRSTNTGIISDQEVFLNLFKSLSLYDTTAAVYFNDLLQFTWKVSKLDVKPDYKNRVIKLTILDEQIDLKDFNLPLNVDFCLTRQEAHAENKPYTSPGGKEYGSTILADPNYGGMELLKYILHYIFYREYDLDNSNIVTDENFYSDWQVYIPSPDEWIELEGIAHQTAMLLKNPAMFSSYGDVLKAICDNYCSIILKGFDNTIRLLPRYYLGGYIRDISKNDIADENIDSRFVEAKQALYFKYLTGGYFAGTFNYSYNEEYFFNGYVPTDPASEFDILDSKYKREIIIPFPLSLTEENIGGEASFTTFAEDSTGEFFRARCGQAKYRTKSSYWSGANSIRYYAAELIKENEFNNRHNIILTLKGLSFPLDMFYRLPDSDLIYRIKKIQFDRINQRSKINFIEAVEL